VNLTGVGTRSDSKRVQQPGTSLNYSVQPLLVRTFLSKRISRATSTSRVGLCALEPQFGGDRQIVGRSIALDGADYTVIV